SALYTKEMLIVDVPVNGRLTPQAVKVGSFDRAIPDMEDSD
ncbi:MAG: NADH-quinone oxidoreductase subunit I, partial [Chloroflexi bacterium]|nr:NADH-quinone oxidoreductase subunit I [Chloroflexota bacterium]